VVSAEILRQCDLLDGVADGIITEPDICNFRPETLLCTKSKKTDCLTAIQVQALRNIYSPVVDGSKLIYPRYSPGAEADPIAGVLFSGTFISLAAVCLLLLFPALPSPHPTRLWIQDWERYVILNVTDHDFTNFGLADIALFEKINAGGISTFSGELSAFRNRGGKFLTYHGHRDPVRDINFHKILGYH
jgi:hypothetical protein